jgi:hypothetical protein
LAACGGDDESGGDDATEADDEGGTEPGSGGHDRGDYVDLMSTEEGVNMTMEETRCIVGAMVDVVGVDTLEAHGAWDQISENPDIVLEELGVTLDEQEKEEMFGRLDTCIDMRSYLEEVFVLEGSSPEVARCTVDGIDDATFRRVVVNGFTQRDGGGLEDAYQRSEAACS